MLDQKFIPSVTTAVADNMTFTTLTDELRQETYLPVKAAFDVFMAAVVLTAALPVFLLVAFLIKLETPGPVFFKQTRRGINGRRFQIYKFRTMTAGRHCESSVTRDFDPRITRLGKFLRDSKIDELPQLLNIIRGEMSVIGPRPLSESESEEIESSGFAPNHPGFMHLCRPGLIGLEQINRKSKLSYAKRFELNAEYAEKMSLAMDLHVFVQSVIQCRLICSVVAVCALFEAIILAVAA